MLVDRLAEFRLLMGVLAHYCCSYVELVDVLGNAGLVGRMKSIRPCVDYLGDIGFEPEQAHEWRVRQ